MWGGTLSSQSPCKCLGRNNGNICSFEGKILTQKNLDPAVVNSIFQEHNNKEDHLIYFIYRIHWVVLTPKEYSNDAMHFAVTDFNKCKDSLLNMSEAYGSDHIIKLSTVPPQSGPDHITEPLYSKHQPLAQCSNNNESEKSRMLGFQKK